MVAEKCGRIRIYDTSSDYPLQSLDCPAPPLISADWAPSNNLVVGGAAGSSWFLWDLSQSRYPIHVAVLCCALLQFARPVTLKICFVFMSYSQPLESKAVHKSPIRHMR